MSFTAGDDRFHSHRQPSPDGDDRDRHNYGGYGAPSSGRGLAISGIPRHSFSRVPVGSKASSKPTDPLLLPSPFLDSSRGHSPDSSRKPVAVKCKTNRSFYQSRRSCLAVTLIILAIYSTVFSGIYLVVAFTQPAYGHKIHTKQGAKHGGISLATATLLSTFFARTIELSFVTVFVSVLGQALSRRAFRKNSRGITIAELSMRSWIMQPGTMIVHWESVRYAALTVLGVVSLTVAMLALFYTTAAEALVAPKLRLSGWQDKLMYGRVTVKYAWPDYVGDQCQTPIQKGDDSSGGTTCLQIEHAGQSFHNFAQYLATWTTIANTGNSSLTDLSERPVPVGMLYDNTTVTGSWVEIRNTTDISINTNRTVNNVTLAMPHSGIFDAARDLKNDIMQPEDLEGLGEYTIIASLPSPSVNVICAGISQDELKPFIMTEWPNSTVPYYPSPLNKTVVDDIFGFGHKYGKRNVTRVPPIFPVYPIEYNTILNTTGWYADSIYLVGKSPTADPPYVLCSLRSAFYPNCSTRYNVSFSGGSMASNCEDPTDLQAYNRLHPEAPVGWVEPDWKNIASEWGNALSMNAGVSKDNASNARLLTEFILGANPDRVPANQLDPALPSIAEALATLAGSTLLLSARDAPFIHHWPYPDNTNILRVPQYQNFSAIMRAQQYQSGGTLGWQGAFYIVLFLVFFTNVVCLGGLLITRGQVTDFTEQQNMFSLLINSPPSRRLAGSCGGGPEKNHLKVPWYVIVENEHVFLEGKDEEEETSDGMNNVQAMDEEESPILANYSALANRKSAFFWD